MKYLCFDLGTSHTGVAISHEGKLASPLATIQSNDNQELLAKIITHITKHQPDLSLVGNPPSGPISDLSLTIVNALISQGIKAEQVIEDLSSKVARHHLSQSGRSVSHRHRQEHAAAAAVILQDYLDTLLE